jgi:hypothetical protein
MSLDYIARSYLKNKTSIMFTKDLGTAVPDRKSSKIRQPNVIGDSEPDPALKHIIGTTEKT